MVIKLLKEVYYKKQVKRGNKSNNKNEEIKIKLRLFKLII
jgi:hypothetical protein